MKILDFLHDLHPTSRLLCLGNRPHDPLQGGKLEILGTGKILPNREQAGKFAADPWKFFFSFLSQSVAYFQFPKTSCIRSSRKEFVREIMSKNKISASAGFYPVNGDCTQLSACNLTNAYARRIAYTRIGRHLYSSTKEQVEILGKWNAFTLFRSTRMHFGFVSDAL